MRWYHAIAIVLGVVLLLGVAPVQAQNAPNEPPSVGFDQRLNAQVPLDLAFRDEADNVVTLGTYFTTQPVILTLGYYECPMLCSMVRDNLLKSLQALPLSIGKEFAVVNVSIDPGETPNVAAATKAIYVQRYGRPDAAAGWHFLTGSESSIASLAQAIGFRYSYDAEIDQYAHPSGIVVLTPQGKIARYFYGIDYPEQDLRLGLVEAANERIGSPVDQVLLLCYQYDPVTGKYTMLIGRVVRLAGVFTVLGIGVLVGGLLWREQWRKPRNAGL